jgi:hypothetical protein
MEYKQVRNGMEEEIGVPDKEKPAGTFTNVYDERKMQGKN